MPSRTTAFVNDNYYHIYNRGSEKRWIFENRWDYKRFLKILVYYQFAGPKPKFSKFSENKINLNLDKKIVEIVAYCLMPNHFHLLLKQVQDQGITEFLSKISNSYTKFFNIKYDRVGPLLQGEFKSVMVETDEQLLHLSRYIHLNPLIAFLVKDLRGYSWSSYNEYLEDHDGICTKKEILGFFKNTESYQQFILDQISYAQELDQIKHQLIDEGG